MIVKYPKLLTEEIKAENVKYAFEGYLFPATYPFYEENPSVESIVDKMLTAMDSNVSTLYMNFLQKMKNLFIGY